ncbi:ankyrin repeat domain-containing protein [Legionella hackeliae]|uniref:Uncharacterized protein n=1 Tax=Legionella hackeliae TaxID=449 RepID=A0A0A8UR33_LEGHA|nr:ankyrin repeat domain-containing protein [Legionella hackeliae]KTD12910.1 Ankyrin repeats (3 copies) [Legionella hackeliae]CEK09219.1 protein of unknown function [ankyrin repeat][STPK domain] [Legionella hackeliae]STX49126.1 Ankyrin repeats (3 copies) [Legionella hackeliae]
MKISDLLNLTDQQLSKLTTLEITDKKIKESQLQELIRLLPKLTSLEIITCKGNLRGKSFTKLLHELPKCPSLSYLFFPNNKLTNTELNGLIDVLPRFKHLVAVELTNNKFSKLSPDRLAKLLEHIKHCGSLVTFDISRNKFSENACAQINKALASNRTKAEKLIDAVRHGNLFEVRKLLLDGANVNSRIVPEKAKDGALQSPLRVAAQNGDLSMVKFLVKKGAEMLPDGLGYTPLKRAQEDRAFLSRNTKKAALSEALGKVIDYLSSVNNEDNEYKLNKPLQLSVSENGFFGAKAHHIKSKKDTVEKELLPLSQSFSVLN